MGRKRNRDRSDIERRFTIDAHDLADGITYDSHGRMEYHPEFHPNQGKRFTLAEKIYLAKFNHFDGTRTLALALGRSDKAVKMLAYELARKGLIDKYRNMSLDEWEAILAKEEAEC